MAMLPATAQASSASDLLAASSATAIEDTLHTMRRRFRRWDRWLTNTHPYKDAMNALKGNLTSIDGPKLSEYIAASVPLHVADGWTFLSRAFDAIKSGDRNTAVHLAYYAELRAAMSLLASEGVGVFNFAHVAINRSLDPTVWAGSNTHRAAWDLLQCWADDPVRSATLLTSFKVETRTIDNWLDQIGVFPSVQHLVARDWLRAWSIDLAYFPIDRNLRNHTSYRPSRISPDEMAAINTSTEVIAPLLRTWDALEPSADSGGAAIDRALLFQALSLARNQPLGPLPAWRMFIDRLHGVASRGLELQLKNPYLNDFDVLRWAAERGEPPSMQAVVARATLLLRIASAVCSQRLAHAQIGKDDLEFWWGRFGDDGGFWTHHSDVESFGDLWDGVNDARVDVENSIASFGSAYTMADLAGALGQGVALTQFSRTPLWLLGVD